MSLHMKLLLTKLAEPGARRNLVSLAVAAVLCVFMLGLEFLYWPFAEGPLPDAYWLDLLATVLVACLLFYGARSLRRLRKHAKALERSFLAFMDGTSDALLISTLDGHILEINFAATSLLGCTEAQLRALRTSDLDPERYLHAHPELRFYMERGDTITYETVWRRPDGEWLMIESRARRAHWLDQPVIIEQVRDISARRAEESALRARMQAAHDAHEVLASRIEERTAELHRRIIERNQAEQRAKDLSLLLGEVIDCMPSMLVTVDTQRRVTHWNQQAALLTGISAQQAVGKSLTMLLPQFVAPIDRLTEATRYGRRQHQTRLHARLHDRQMLFDVMVYPLRPRGRGVVVRVDDVTERVRLEQTLVQSEKMLSLGGLAAGMAHEINNPLGAILQNTQNIERRLNMHWPRNQHLADHLGLPQAALEQFVQQQRLPGLLSAIREAGERAAAIVNDMLAFARPGSAERVPVELPAVIDAALRLAATDYDHRKRIDFRLITIVRDYWPEMPRVRAQRNQLEQVFLNLLSNAAQAMFSAQHSDPQITVRVYCEDEQAVAEVRDNGPGMTDAVRKRVFEPFFTTKDEGSGTGLGLSVSYYIITDQMKGQMEVESAPGEGAVFRIRLPLVEEAPASRQRPQIELPFDADAPPPRYG